MPSGSEDHEDKVTKWAKVKASHIDKIAMLVGPCQEERFKKFKSYRP